MEIIDLVILFHFHFQNCQYELLFFINLLKSILILTMPILIIQYFLVRQGREDVFLAHHTLMEFILNLVIFIVMQFNQQESIFTINYLLLIKVITAMKKLYFNQESSHLKHLKYQQQIHYNEACFRRKSFKEKNFCQLSYLLHQQYGDAIRWQMVVEVSKQFLKKIMALFIVKTLFKNFIY